MSIFARRRSTARAAATVAAGVLAAAGSIGAGSAGATAAAAPAPAHPPVSRGERVAVVAVPGGRQAAVYDQHGHLTFWRQPGSVGRWLRSGASSYPLLPPAFGAPGARAVGAHLPGMRTAVFIVHGNFAGDSDADWIAYGTGPRGWGRLAPRSGRLVPTGRSSTDDRNLGLTLNIQTAGGLLETSALPDVVPNVEGPLLPVNRFWRWTGSSFSEARDNIVDARAARDPLSGPLPAPLPVTVHGSVGPSGAAQNCPTALPAGVYAARESSVSNPPRLPFSINNGVTVTVRLSTGDGTEGCAFTVPADFPISLPTTTRTHGIRWITGPVWLLSTAGSLGDIRDDLALADFRPRGAAPYFIPPALGVSGFARVAAPLAPAAVRVTIDDGHLAALAVLAASSAA